MFDGQAGPIPTRLSASVDIEVHLDELVMRPQDAHGPLMAQGQDLLSKLEQVLAPYGVAQVGLKMTAYSVSGGTVQDDKHHTILMTHKTWDRTKA